MRPHTILSHPIRSMLTASLGALLLTACVQPPSGSVTSGEGDEMQAVDMPDDQRSSTPDLPPEERDLGETAPDADMGASCPETACSEEGESICVGDEVHTCNLDDQGCLIQEKVLSCEGDMVCEAGGCTTHLCPAERLGTSYCDPGRPGEVFTCVIDVDGVTWVEQPIACEPGEVCESGECVMMPPPGACPAIGNLQCTGTSPTMGGALNGREVCTMDGNGALVWDGKDCDPNEYCDSTNGATCKPCAHECMKSELGLARCDGSVIEVCEANMNGCRRWVEKPCTTSQRGRRYGCDVEASTDTVIECHSGACATLGCENCRGTGAETACSETGGDGG